MSKRMTVLVAVIAGVLAGAVVGGSALVGATAQSGGDSTSTKTSTSDSTRTSTSTSIAEHPTRPCGALLSMLPAELRTDLEAVRALPEGERREALRKLVESARAGEYGEQVEQFADRWKDHRRELWQKLPADLRADLAELRGMTPEQRRAAVGEMRKDALAGEYGEQAQQFAERLQEHHEECGP